MGIGKKIKKTVLLPKRIVEEVNKFDISLTHKSYAFKFLWLLIRDSQRKHENIYSPMERTFQDLESNYTKYYYKWIKLLLKSKLSPSEETRWKIINIEQVIILFNIKNELEQLNQCLRLSFCRLVVYN